MPGHPRKRRKELLSDPNSASHTFHDKWTWSFLSLSVSCFLERIPLVTSILLCLRVCSASQTMSLGAGKSAFPSGSLEVLKPGCSLRTELGKARPTPTEKERWDQVPPRCQELRSSGPASIPGGSKFPKLFSHIGSPGVTAQWPPRGKFQIDFCPWSPRVLTNAIYASKRIHVKNNFNTCKNVWLNTSLYRMTHFIA